MNEMNVLKWTLVGIDIQYEIFINFDPSIYNEVAELRLL